MRYETANSFDRRWLSFNVVKSLLGISGVGEVSPGVLTSAAYVIYYLCFKRKWSEQSDHLFRATQRMFVCCATTVSFIIHQANAAFYRTSSNTSCGVRSSLVDA